MDVQRLKAMLSSRDTALVTKALVEIRSRHMKSKSRMRFFVQQNCVENIIPLLDLPNSKVINISLSILGNLMLESTPRTQLRCAGGIGKIIAIIKNLDEKEISCRAFRVIANLAQDPKACRSLHQNGLAALIGKNLVTEDENFLCVLVRCARIVSDSPQYRAWLAEESVYEQITNILSREEDKLGDELTKATVKCLAKLTHGATLVQAEKVMTSAAKLTALCRNEQRQVWENSLMTLVNLSQHTTLRPSLGNAGVVACLVEKYSSGELTSFEVSHVVTALCLYCRESVNREKLRELDGCKVFVSVLESRQQDFLPLHDRVLNSLLQFIYDNHSLNVFMSVGLIESLVAFLERHLSQMTRHTCVLGSPFGSPENSTPIGDRGDDSSKAETVSQPEGDQDSSSKTEDQTVEAESGDVEPKTSTGDATELPGEEGVALVTPKADEESSTTTLTDSKDAVSAEATSQDTTRVFRLNSPSYQAVQYELEQFLQLRETHQQATGEGSPAAALHYLPVSPSGSVCQSPDRSPGRLSCGYSPDSSPASVSRSGLSPLRMGSGSTTPRSPTSCYSPVGSMSPASITFDLSPPGSPSPLPGSPTHHPFGAPNYSPISVAGSPGPASSMTVVNPEDETFSDEETPTENQTEATADDADPEQTSEHEVELQTNPDVVKDATSSSAEEVATGAAAAEEKATSIAANNSTRSSSKEMKTCEEMTVLDPKEQETRIRSRKRKRVSSSGQPVDSSERTGPEAVAGPSGNQSSAATPTSYKYFPTPILQPNILPKVSPIRTLVTPTNVKAGEATSESGRDQQRLDWILQLLSRLSHAERPHPVLTSTRTIKALFDLMCHEFSTLDRVSRILSRLTKNLYCLLPFVLEMHTSWMTLSLEKLEGASACDECENHANSVKCKLNEISHNLTLLAETGYAVGEMCHRLVMPAFPVREKQAISVSASLLVKQRKLLYNILVNHDSLDVILDIFETGQDELVKEAVLSLSRLAGHLGVVSPHLALMEEESSSCFRTYGDEDKVLALVLDDGSEVTTSKEIVTNKSQVFSAMLDGGFAESGQSRVNIPFTSRSALTCLIHYYYGCRWCEEYRDLSPAVLLELMTLSDKFLLPELNMRVSHEVIRACMKEEHVLEIYRSSLQKQYAVRSSESTLSRCTVSSVLVGDMTTLARTKLVTSLTRSDLGADFLDDVSSIIRTKLKNR